MTGRQTQRHFKLLRGGRCVAAAAEDLPQVKVDFGVVRIEVERALQRALRAGVPALVEHRHAQPHEHGGRRAGERSGAVQRAFRCGKLAEHQMCEPEVFERRAMARLSRDGLPERRQCIARVSCHEIGDAEQA